MAESDGPNLQLSYFKAQPSDDVHRRTINERIRELARETPDKVAFVFRSPNEPRSSLTRQEFLEKVTLLGLHFVYLGIKPGDKVAILMPSGEYFLLVQFGLYMAGAVAVNSLSQDEKEITEMAMNLGCTAKVVQNVDRNSAYGAMNIRLSIGQNMSGYGLGVDVSSLLKNVAPKDVSLPDITADARAMMVLTSGSTGAQKLVTHTHSTLLFGSYSYSTGVSYSNSDIVINERPMQWIGGYPLVYLGSGATVVYTIPQMGKPTDETFLVEVFVSENVTSNLMMEYRLNGILARPDLLSKMPRLKSAVLGGQKITKKNVQRILKLCDVSTILYASTECISFSSATFRDAESFEEGTAGYFCMGTEAKVVNDAGVIVTVGEVGELHLRGDGSSKEYVSLEGNSRVILDGDNWCHTSDMAIMKSDGMVIIKGRKTEMIKRATVRISPDVIERKLQEHLDVQEVAVVGIPNERLYEEICACIIIKPGSTLTLEDIKEAAEEIFKPSLAPDGLGLMPGFFLILEDFPRTLSGKRSRLQLSKKAAAVLQSRV